MGWLEEARKTRAEQRAKEAVGKDKRLAEECKFEDGVWRWKSSNAIPFQDFLEDAGVPSDVLEVCFKQREIETMAFLKEYTDNQTEATQEERWEMESAFGKGTKVVDVISGRVTQL